MTEAWVHLAPPLSVGSSVTEGALCRFPPVGGACFRSLVEGDQEQDTLRWGCRGSVWHQTATLDTRGLSAARIPPARLQGCVMCVLGT